MSETILFYQGIELPDDILALAQSMKPADFDLIHLPNGASVDELVAAMSEADYLVGFLRFIADDDLIRCADRLKLIQVLSAGYDSINIEGARRARIPVCTNGGANSVAVAEHTIMLMLAVYRKLVAFHANVSAGRWHEGIPRSVDIYELQGKTVGLIGLGNIGRQVAKRLIGFDCNVIYTDIRRPSASVEKNLGVRFASQDELLANADIVSLHVPLNDETREMIDAAALARMKTNAVLINTCRGGVVHEAALVDALRDGHILGAGLDAQEKERPDRNNPLLMLPNVTLTPHSAGPTVDSFRKRFHNAYANIERVAQGLPADHVIPEMHDLFPPDEKV